MTSMPRATVVDVLECLGDEFQDFAEGFSRGEYLLWLGSGLSRDVVPNVAAIVERMLEFLRTNVEDPEASCRFSRALDEVLDVAGVPAATRASLDYSVPVDSWPDLDDIVGRLVDRYADVLNVQVQDEDEDFLVWDGLDVPNTYGAPELEPGVEHVCVAVLMLEGVVRAAPTTNWDGLVEAAMAKLVGDDVDRCLCVVVRPEDFRDGERQAELLKFHGCAVRAILDEGEYRHRLIARKKQISGWTTRPENQMMKNRLEHHFAAQSAFVVGLSAQDANIHTVLHEATQGLARTWPHTPPAVVFAEQSLHHHHRHVLQVTYGDSYAANVEAISESALLGAYAKPALVGLLLFTLVEKLRTLVGCVSELALSEPDTERVRGDLLVMRDSAGALADADPAAFVQQLVSFLAFALSVFRKGEVASPDALHYRPILPVARAVADADYPGASLGRLAVAISLLARGSSEGQWSLSLGTAASPSDGVLNVASGHRRSKVFAVRDSRSLSQLEVDGVLDPDDDEAVVLLAEAAQALTRSPRPRYGRTGTSGVRCVDLEDLCGSVDTADELFEAFRLEGAL